MRQNHHSSSLEETLREFVAAINDSGGSHRNGGGGAFAFPPMSATFPSLSLFPSLRHHPAVENSEEARTLALRCLARPVAYGSTASSSSSKTSSQCDLHDISRAPQRMVTSLAASFEELVRSCLRNYGRRQGQLRGQRRRRRREQGQRTAAVRPSAEVRRVVVKGTKGASFVAAALSPPPPASSDVGRDENSASSAGGSECWGGGGGGGRCELPIRAAFRFEIDYSDGAEEGTTVVVEARGTVVGSASSSPESPYLETLDSVAVTFDYPALLLSLRQAARLAAYRLIARRGAARGRSSAPAAAAPLPRSIGASDEAAAVTPCSSPRHLPPLSMPSSYAAAEDREGRQRRRRPTTLLPPKKRVRYARAVSPSPSFFRGGSAH